LTAGEGGRKGGREGERERGNTCNFGFRSVYLFFLH
jgi:hypothetical protein